MSEKSEDNAQSKAQKAHAKALQDQKDAKEQQRIHAESGPVSVMEKVQANPNPPELHNKTPRHEAQTASGMDENTLQEDVGLRDKETGLQPKEAGEVENASAISTHQHLSPPQGDANAPEESGGGKKGKSKGK